MNWRCLGEDWEGAEAVESVSVSRRRGGSGIERGARTGWRCRNIGTVVTGVFPTLSA
jgi:hypothetical protein